MSDNRSSGGDGIVILVIVAVAGAGILLWWLPKVVAWGALVLVRDAVVYLFGDYFSEEGEQAAVVSWRLIVPGVLFIACFSLVQAGFSRPRAYIPWIVTLPLGLSAAGLVVYHYYKLYQQIVPRHRSWARFVAADIKLRTTFKLAWIEEWFRWRL